MKIKKIFLPVLFIIFFLIFPIRALSRNSDLEVNYVINRDLYFQKYRTYLSSKRAFLDRETLERKNILFRNLQSLLYTRNKLLETYLIYLINVLQTSLSEEELDKVRKWEVWLHQYEQEFTQINRPEDLNLLYRRSADLAEVYPELETDIYFRLANYAFSGQNEVIDQIRSMTADLRKFTDDQGWVVEVNDKVDQARRAQNEAMTIMEETRVRRPGDIRGGWVSAQKYFDQAQDNLELALRFIDEVIKKFE